MEFVSPEGLRLDGRRPGELRRLGCELSVLQAADGSAIFEMGNTKVLAAVFGPHEVENRSQQQPDRAIIKCEYGMAAFSTGERRKRGKGDRRSQELSKVIGAALEQTVMTHLLPRSQIDVYVQVLQADGGTRCAAINAAVLALAEAGVPLRDLCGAVAAGHLEGTPLLDLNYSEDAAGGPDVSIALHPLTSRLVLLQSDSRLPVETFETVMKLASEGCRTVSGFMREKLLEHTQRLADARGVVKS
mmetsp:Transcript_11432/g.20163  ORF Transcript_11432/g.20163 Transcript_11432/m.20163 type:complete len:245 (-) Transcript_11432:375-1109(-)|eukprot:CAMPEP_0119109068 /NCGR_PEP_ID=MMETSP1180-20130426/17080_1 /TAXON_ID=3052 ORGANISM="Chlamydomonas cf sp, Strain CCMP681" /NCGR_SAMPLE_ID=MMETSP1180 /ASSEMBLY_ACC=CAM_ASM_000741 /LENGTH=244 /DNA_ID=CAMNT_0007094777 /DNA_START=165 /DNA_END=899 /DNA_ORIENTATION=+